MNNGRAKNVTIDRGPSKAVGTLALETQLVIDRLMKAIDQVGTIIPYEELNIITGKDVQENGRHHVTSAINAILRDRSVLFAPVEGAGIKRLSHEEALEYTSTAIKSIRRKAGRWKRKLAGVRYEELNRDKQTEYNVTASLLGAFQSMASAPKVKALASKVADAQAKLPLHKMLEAMKE